MVAAASKSKWLGAGLTNARMLILIGGLLNVVIVTYGVRDVFSLPMALAMGMATVLIAVQYLLGSGLAGNGLIGWLRAPLYLGMIAFNLVLAVSGIVAIGQPDVLGRRSFETIASSPKSQIRAGADNLTSTEQALQALSRHSEARAAQENNPGGSCGPTGEGMGPVYRVRQNDKSVFATLSGQFAQRAAAMRRIRGELDSTIASYSVARHGATAARIDQLVEQARLTAQDGAVATMRETLRTRLEGVRGTTPDPLTGQAVRCPDPELDNALGRVLAVAPPPVLSVEAMPSEPDHRAAAAAFLDETMRLWRGEEVDLGMWGLPTLLALFPDCIFLLGIGQEHSDRRRRLGMLGRLAARIDLDEADWEAVVQAADRTAASDHLQRLEGYHATKGNVLGRTDFMCVPTGADHLGAYLIAMALVETGSATYCGRGTADLLPRGALPRPADGKEERHFFVLGHRVWRRLLIEMMRSAASSAGRGAAPDSPGEAWEEAAE